LEVVHTADVNYSIES